MRIDPAGYPFVAGALVAAVLVGSIASWALAVPLVLLAGAFTFFFRDPDRAVTDDPAAVLSPADGRVMVAGATTGHATPPGNWQQISIFLSPMDVHVNRIPIGGRVTRVQYHPGRFLPAYKAEAGDLNEYTEVWIEHEGQAIVFRQIVGILARRIVCRVREGDLVKAGDRFGVMKFGSRMDLFLPPSARLRVNPGEQVMGAVTVLAELRR
ncbi:MAG: phosphatidylserine decarboxylase [Vicinamibacterales bacterium]